MRTRADGGTCARLDIVQQAGEPEDQASRECDHKISVVVSDASHMTSELLARARSSEVMWLASLTTTEIL